MTEKALLLFTAVLFAPVSVSAQVVISEIMYDLAEGSDSGREWIEVYNESSAAVDLTEWKVFENNSNHGINAVGASSLQPGMYAVIADNAEKFKIDHPSYSGLLLDSAFSLNNSGETLTLRCCGKELTDKDSVSYSSDLGATGDGASLSRAGASFVPTDPTPGSQPGSARTVQPEPSPPPTQTQKLPEPTPPAQEPLQQTAKVVPAGTTQQVSQQSTSSDVVNEESGTPLPVAEKKIAQRQRPEREEQAVVSETFVEEEPLQLASVQAAAASNTTNNSWIWWVGALGIALVGAGGAYVMGRRHAREWTIVEDSSE